MFLMEWLSFFTLTLMLVSSANADLSRGVILHLNWMSQTIKNNNQCVDTRGTSKTDNTDMAELCMNQVCGTTDKITNSIELASSLIQDPEFIKNTAKTTQEVLNAINSLLNVNSKQMLLTVEGYKELKSRGDLTPEPKYQKLHDFYTLVKELKRISFEPGPDQHLPFVINREESMKNLTDLSENQKKWVIDSIDHFMRTPIGIDLILNNLIPPRDFLKFKYPNLSFKDALKREGEKTYKRASQLQNGSSGSIIKIIAGFSQSLNDPIIEKAANGEEMSDAEVSEFMYLQSGIPIFLDILTPREEGGQTVLLNTSSVETFADFIKRTNLDQQIAQYVDDLKNPQKLADIRYTVYQECFTNYIFQMATLPNRSQIDEAVKNGDWAKGKIKEILGPVLSIPTTQMINNVIDGTFFSMPRSQETFHQYFINKLQASIQDSVRETEHYKELIKNQQHKPNTLLNIHYGSEDFTIDQHFNDTKKLCDDFKITLTSDNSLTSLGGIITSWVSVRKPDLGKAIMLHELGHIVFKYLNSEQASSQSRAHFAEIRQCLSENHPGGDILSSEHYVEEDWCDLIASKGTYHSDINIGCELNEQEDNKFINLDLNNPNQKDLHSTDFFRALQNYKVQKGTLPSACNQLNQEQDNRWKFKTCF